MSNAGGAVWLMGTVKWLLHPRMDKFKPITGEWRGTYSHDPSEHIPQLGTVSFALVLKQGWFGRFTGSVSEEAGRGMPGTGSIEGYVSLPRIEFTKRMPVCYVVKPGGDMITLREHLTSEGYVCERDLRHPPIFYEGEFSAEGRAAGTWLLRGGPFRLPNGQELDMPHSTGVWTIEKRVT